MCRKLEVGVSGGGKRPEVMEKVRRQGQLLRTGWDRGQKSERETLSAASEAREQVGEAGVGTQFK